MNNNVKYYFVITKLGVDKITTIVSNEHLNKEETH